MQECKTFDAGIKPAILGVYEIRSKKEKGLEAETEFFKKYKGTHRYIILEIINRVLFFRDADVYNYFKEHGVKKLHNGVEEVDVHVNEVLGEVLGFPPLATKKFKLMVKENADELVVINYYGIKFGCFKEDITECLDWMVENRPVTDTIKERLGITIQDSVTKEITWSDYNEI